MHFLKTLSPALAMAALLASCGDPVSLKYSVKAEAEAEHIFARGWLPPIIPPSAKNISMVNDLDLNTSKGEFEFDPADYDPFIQKLKRVAMKDEKGLSAFAFKQWTFWINKEKNRCRFHMSAISQSLP